jgi:fluoroacetyl-CoA thioesterase
MSLPVPEPGRIGEASIVVERAHLASSLGSGSLDVLATPAMIALMEQAAVASIEGVLEAGMTSVGTHIDVRHLAASPPGVRVTARAELVEVAERRLMFRVTASDGADVIGEGKHERAIVDANRLLARANQKLPS